MAEHRLDDAHTPATGQTAESGDAEHYLRREFHELLASDSAVVQFLSSACLDGIWYWDLSQPEHEWMSDSFWWTLGYDPATKPHLAAAWQDIINRDDLNLALENAQRHFVDPDHPYDQLVRYRHAAGHTVWIRCRGLAIRDDAGKPTRMLGAHTDVTSLKVAEDELRARTKDLDLILDHVPARIWLKDDRNKILRCNERAARSMGMSDAEALRGADTYALFPKMAKKYHEDDLSVLDSGQARLGVTERYAPSGAESGWVSTDKIPLYDELGRRRLLVVSTDVTERVEQQRRLAQLNERLKDFAQIAAHDLSAPLRQISVLSEILSEELSGVEAISDDAKEALGHIGVAVSRMRSMVTSLHELSYAEATDIRLDPCDLGEVVSQAAALEELALRTSRARVTVEALPTVLGSDDLLTMLFRNLLSNACKYAGDDAPKVRVHHRLDAQRGVDLVYFEDEGIGIAPESHETVFESFRRLHHAQDIEGTGIGLAICRRIAQAHGGTLTIDPRAGKGVRFVLALPVCELGEKG